VEIIFTGRHQGVNASVKSYLTSKLERSIKNIPKVNGVHVIIDSERFQHKVEVLIHLNHMRLRAAEKAENLTASIDKVLDKLERQLKKYKDKLQHHRSRDKEILLSKAISEERAEETKGNPRLIRTKRLAPKPMDESEAMMQLKLSEDVFLVFLNSETDVVNVIYKKKDGNFGLIEPGRREKKI
jgi:putative sigma-54 modulation protein